MFKRCVMSFLFGVTVAMQFGCVPLAAGVAGAAVGHEVAEDQDKKDGDRD